VVLWFGGDEYEGMGPAPYRMQNSVIRDGDGDVVPHRELDQETPSSLEETPLSPPQHKTGQDSKVSLANVSVADRVEVQYLGEWFVGTVLSRHNGTWTVHCDVDPKGTNFTGRDEYVRLPRGDEGEKEGASTTPASAVAAEKEGQSPEGTTGPSSDKTKQTPAVAVPLLTAHTLKPKPDGAALGKRSHIICNSEGSKDALKTMGDENAAKKTKLRNFLLEVKTQLGTFAQDLRGKQHAALRQQIVGDVAGSCTRTLSDAIALFE